MERELVKPVKPIPDKGVGSEDFAAMDELDSDDALLSCGGMVLFLHFYIGFGGFIIIALSWNSWGIGES